MTHSQVQTVNQPTASKPDRYSAERRDRQRQVALRCQPWKHSTGPKTVAGKARVALNGKKRQKGHLSVREARRLVDDIGGLVQAMQASRQQVQRLLSPDAPASGSS